MNNKRGGAGAKIIIVLILMLASAIGGAYGYRVMDGKMAVNEAMKAVEDVDISDYDTAEQTQIQEYIDKATNDLSSAKTRKQVYEIIAEFISGVEKVQTKNEKALEQALKEAEEAKQQLNSQSGQNSTAEQGSSGQSADTSANGDTGTGESTGSYKSNDLNESEDSSKGGGLIGSLLGGMANNSSSND